MSPAPANDSVALMSPFFTTAAATPLSERDCNGAIACPASGKPNGVCALRRGASFLDVDDARLAASDKASFLIPEDSYLPGQENCAAPCAPAAPPSFYRPAHQSCPLSGPNPNPCDHAPLPATSAQRQHRLTSPFLLLDSPVFGCPTDDGDLYSESLFGSSNGGMQLDAASECFEKAVQALEMVERPVELGHVDPRATHPPHLRPCPHPHDQPRALARSAALDSFLQSRCVEAGCADGADRGLSTQDDNHHNQQQQKPLQTVRRVSSLAGAQAAAAPLEHDVALPQPPASSETSALDAADGMAAPSGRGAAEGAAGCGSFWGAPGAAASTPGWPYQHPRAVGTMSALPQAGALPLQRQHHQGAAAVAAAEEFAVAQVCGGPEAALPQQSPVRAFHHKTGGPCDHCGATESPQWRRGPPAKPMLCNACGTRYRRTNQLNPAAAYTPAGRAAAAAAAAAHQQPTAAKRAPKQLGGQVSSKRGRASYY